MNVYEKIAEYSKTERIAVRYQGEKRSYADLYRSMISFSYYLLERYDDCLPILIYGHKDIDIIACMLGCSLSGHPYVPIDSASPQSRLDMIVDEIQPNLILDFTGNLKSNRYTVLNKSQIEEILTGDSWLIPKDSVFPNDESICYILFTSGSTGTPKGVEIKFSNLYAYMEAFCPTFYAGEDEHTVLNSLAYSFDVSVGYIYPSLYYGYTLYSVDKRMLENLGELFEEFKKSNVQTVMTTPSIMNLCTVSANFGRNILPQVNRFIFCGEILTNELARKLKARFQGAEVINTYGPTETTILVTEVKITDDMITANRPLPIGHPLPGVVLKVTDENVNALPEKEKGELQILGKSVGPGYFRRPDLTQKAFYIDATTGLRGYHTGDVCYFDEGEYYFCGRNDDQIKLNGYRIELGDIENNLLKIPYIYGAAVIPVMDQDQVLFLTAFVLLNRWTETSQLKQQIAIKKDLSQFVASYMVPHKFIIKTDFPMNTNGKTDRKALAAELYIGKKA